ncbi:uncharacterized protein [Halyomorpha halys]|uniref:uncharacterized protein n=1 Tax=Halyomorpha halys TaxID=286706 RepID=UPI0006D4FB26|nr:keratin-associated protein 19-2-like [Halyomorpha halys]
MAHSKIFFLIVIVSCLAAVVLSFPADSPLGPGKRIPKGVAPPGEKDLEGAESYGYGWGGYGGYGGWGWGGYGGYGGYGGWGGWGYPGYGYGYGYYGYPWGGYYGGYGPYWGGYWW